MTHDKVRQDFEKATESYYEGDFTKYADGVYVSDRQQDDFIMFQSGYQAGRAAERAEIVTKLAEEKAQTTIGTAVWVATNDGETSVSAMGKAAITKILEVI